MDSLEKDLKEVQKALEITQRAQRQNNAYIWNFPTTERSIKATMRNPDKKRAVKQFFERCMKIPPEEIEGINIDRVMVFDNKSKNGDTVTVKIEFLDFDSKRVAIPYLKNLALYNKDRPLKVTWQDDLTKQQQLERQKESRKKKGDDRREEDAMEAADASTKDTRNGPPTKMTNRKWTK